MGKNRNRNKRKNQNQEITDEENVLFPSSGMNAAASDFDTLNAEATSSFKNDKDKDLTTSGIAETGTKPKMIFHNPIKNTANLDVGNKYKNQISGSPIKNTANLDVGNKYKNQISGSIKQYEKNLDSFYRKYLLWQNERLDTISKLQDLKKKVHDDQLAYDKTNVMFKELNVNSRQLKEDSSNSTIDFFASLGTFLTDAASGITSVAQAVSVDVHNLEFKKIMEYDEEITKPLYVIRSKCLEQYRDVEEVVRCFHAETFGDTLETLSRTLKLDDLWLDLKNVHEENTVSATLSCLDQFISKNMNVATVNKIYDSFENYIDYNPAALDVCKSAGKIAYGIYDTWGRDQKQRNGIAAGASRVANRMIICEEMQELRQLRSRISESETIQTKLESKIEDAIDSLQSELNEMGSLFNKPSVIW